MPEENPGMNYNRTPAPPRAPERESQPHALDKFYEPEAPDPEEVSEYAAYERVSLPGFLHKKYTSAPQVDVLQMREVPQFIAKTLRGAHQTGRLPDARDHYLGVLWSLGLEGRSLQELRSLRRQVTGNWDKDEKVLPEVIKFLGGLTLTKRR